MQYLILSKEQAKELMAEIKSLAEEAFKQGVLVGRGDVAQLSDEQEADAYDAGYEDGNSEGYDEGYSHGSGDSYDEGYTDGYNEGYSAAEISAAEAAAYGEAFEEQPRVHEWHEGTQVIDNDGELKPPFPRYFGL
jgi:hypothetical protein